MADRTPVIRIGKQFAEKPAKKSFDANTCSYCLEPMDEYDDCLDSEDGKHHSVASVKRALRRNTPARCPHEGERK